MSNFKVVQGKNGTQAYRIDMPTTETTSSGFVLLTDGAGRAVPGEMESERFQIRVFTNEAYKGVSVPIDGRKGLNDWYQEHVGYRPDDDAGQPLPINELVCQVAEMVYYHNVEKSQQEPELSFDAISVQMLFEAADKADLDAALDPLQVAAGIITGDRAGLFFSGPLGDYWPTAQQSERLHALIQYLAYERAFNQPAPGSVMVATGAPELSTNYVAYSANETALAEEPLFWSNEAGWGDLRKATIFTEEETRRVERPVSAGDDAEWMSLEEAYHGKMDQMQNDDASIVLTLELSEKENEALRFVLGNYLDNERDKGRESIGTDLMDELAPIEAVILGNAKKIHLTLMTLALLQRALLIHSDGGMDETYGESGLDNAIADLIKRIGDRAKELRLDESLNTYAAQFQCRCPVNQKVIHYHLVIESKTMIPVEQIAAMAEEQKLCFHEPMADAFFKVFGGNQRMSAYHHGVHIRTIRKSA